MRAMTAQESAELLRQDDELKRLEQSIVDTIRSLGREDAVTEKRLSDLLDQLEEATRVFVDTQRAYLGSS